MRLDDRIQLQKIVVSKDDAQNLVETKVFGLINKCKIFPNTKASTIKCNDGQDRVYSYEVVMRKPKSKDDLPRENDIAHVTKSDGTINTEKVVLGFVTLRNWVKVWL